MEIKAIVVGLHHHNDGLVFDCGMPVSVVFDDHNEHSDCAFKVFTEGGLFGGYLAESQYYWGSLATKLGAKLSFEVKALINQGYTISEAVVEEIRGRALKYNKVVLKITLNEPETTSEVVSEEMEEDNMSVEVIGDREGLYTLVGVQYHRDEVEIGSKVLLTLKNNTTFGVDENGENIGVFPQKDTKCAQVEELGLPLERNSEIKQNAVAFEREYIVVGFITETKGNKVSKYCVIQLKSVVEAETEEEPVTEDIEVTDEVIELVTMLQSTNRGLMEAERIVEETTVDEVSVEAETEVEPVTSGETMLKTRIEEIKTSIDVKKAELNQLKSDLEMYEKELRDVEYRNSLITEIRDNIFGMDTEDIKKIHQMVIGDVESSSDEEEVSTSSNNEINNNEVDNWETEIFESALNEIKNIESLEQLYRDCGNPDTIVGKIALDIENMNLEAVIKTGYVHKRNMDKLDDVQIAELNMAIHRQEKILKGIIEE